MHREGFVFRVIRPEGEVPTKVRELKGQLVR